MCVQMVQGAGWEGGRGSVSQHAKHGLENIRKALCAVRLFGVRLQRIECSRCAGTVEQVYMRAERSANADSVYLRLKSGQGTERVPEHGPWGWNCQVKQYITAQRMRCQSLIVPDSLSDPPGSSRLGRQLLSPGADAAR